MVTFEIYVFKGINTRSSRDVSNVALLLLSPIHTEPRSAELTVSHYLALYVDMLIEHVFRILYNVCGISKSKSVHIFNPTLDSV